MVGIVTIVTILLTIVLGIVIYLFIKNYGNIINIIMGGPGIELYFSEAITQQTIADIYRYYRWISGLTKAQLEHFVAINQNLVAAYRANWSILHAPLINAKSAANPLVLYFRNELSLHEFIYGVQENFRADQASQGIIIPQYSIIINFRPVSTSYLHYRQIPAA